MNVTVRRKFRINGKEYSSIEEIPPEYRGAVEKALAKQRLAAIRWILILALFAVAAALVLSHWSTLFR
jgi:hypothetical protein